MDPVQKSQTTSGRGQLRRRFLTQVAHPRSLLTNPNSMAKMKRNDINHDTKTYKRKN
jgi:hypothetical protein